MAKTVVIACKVLEDLFRPHLGANEAIFLEYGLHHTPGKLAPAIQEQVDKILHPSVIALGYGLCGNGLVGLKAGKHTLIAPRVDDCIAMLLGSYQRYLEECLRQPGTYYLSKGWLECGGNPLKEYQTYLRKYGEETAHWLIHTQYNNYKRLLLVASQEGDLASYGPYARQVAAFLGLEYEECLGVDHLIPRLLQEAANPQADPDFVVIPPGGVVEASLFWRE